MSLVPTVSGLVPAYLLADIESGGFSAKKHAFLEFGWLLTDAQFNPISGDSVCVLPQEGRTIEKQAADVNGYTEEGWMERGALPLPEAIAKIQERLSLYCDLPRFAHGAPFDIGFCSHYMPVAEVLGNKFRQDDEGKYIPDWKCSKSVLRAYCKKVGIDPNVKGTLTLENGCKLAGYRRSDSHGAFEDCAAMAGMLRFLYKEGMFDQAAVAA